jgi:hypothetical protein
MAWRSVEAYVLIGAGFPPSLKAHSGYQSPEPARLATFGRGEPVPRICSEWLRP